jgi:molybdopterin synthase catalytic subunit
MSIRIQHEDFDVGAELAAMRQGRPGIGALVSFVGLVRDHGDSSGDSNAGPAVTAMELAHYPGMTEKALQAIVDEAGQRWSLLDTLVIHRVGPLQLCEQIVLVAVASAHRGNAFAAAEFIMDYLKTRAPFWKKEATAEGSHWVEAKDADDSAAARWAER